MAPALLPRVQGRAGGAAGARAGAAARSLRLAAAAMVVICAVRALVGLQESDARAYAVEPAARTASTSHGGRRQQLLASAVAAGVPAGLAAPAGAFGPSDGRDEKKDETVLVPPNPRAGVPSYLFEKPKGFRRYSSPVDPTGYVFRALDDSYFSFVTRAEKYEGPDFTPAAFIQDYQNKFVNATGSSFELISDNSKPNKVDDALGVKYWQVEYVVRTQLGFTFDSLKSLHFITTFAAKKDSLIILNAQSLDDKWDKCEPTLRKVVDSFSVTS